MLSAFSALRVIAPHLPPIERPVGAVAEHAARLEPFRPEAQRHHGEMDGAAAHRLAAVLAAHGSGWRRRRCGRRSSRACPAPSRRRRNLPAAGNMGPRRSRSPRSRFGQPAGQAAAARARADDDEIDRLVLAVLAHRHPAAGLNTSGARPLDGARRRRSGSADTMRSSSRAVSSSRPCLGGFPGIAPVLAPSAHSRAGSPDRRSRSRSRRSGCA